MANTNIFHKINLEQSSLIKFEREKKRATCSLFSPQLSFAFAYMLMHTHTPCVWVSGCVGSNARSSSCALEKMAPMAGD